MALSLPYDEKERMMPPQPAQDPARDRAGAPARERSRSPRLADSGAAVGPRVAGLGATDQVQGLRLPRSCTRT